jgi:hypothetical protein
MSKPKNPNSSGSKSSIKGFGKESKNTQQESSVSELESTVKVTPLPNLASSDDKTIGFTFESAMLHLPIAALTQENEEAKQDWGPVEEKAYERLLEGSTKNVSAQEFLNWLSELEQGHDV